MKEEDGNMNMSESPKPINKNRLGISNSSVWSHFLKNGLLAKCHYCDKSLKIGGQTSSLWKHLKSKHPGVFGTLPKTEPGPHSLQSTSGSCMTVQMPFEDTLVLLLSAANKRMLECSENTPPVTSSSAGDFKPSSAEPPTKKPCDGVRTEMECVTKEGASAEVRPFKPQAEIRLHKGVAKSSVDEHMEFLVSMIKRRDEVRNWKSFLLESLSVDDKIITDKVMSVSLGCVTMSDGVDITGRLPHLVLSPEVVHFYRPNEDGPLPQEITVDGDSDTTVGSQLWTLPCVEFENIWENLIYDTNLKNELMSYVYSLINLSERGANMKIINVNRLVLLLGPPGTGKTSLCRGLSQHLAIRLNSRFPRSVMVEINSHSLFSKWFSESGKLIMKMFEQISELADDRNCMVFVLIDEVESLGMSRETSSSGGEPADSIRAVNALLTQIDAIRRRENVLILCTSNLEKCLDRAFLDRADLVRHVGQPSQIALFTILSECIEELQRIDLVSRDAELYPDPSSSEVSGQLWQVAEAAIGLSGRSIRQIPALACSMMDEETTSLDDCVKLFRKAVEMKKISKEQ